MLQALDAGPQVSLRESAAAPQVSLQVPDAGPPVSPQVRDAERVQDVPRERDARLELADSRGKESSPAAVQVALAPAPEPSVEVRDARSAELLAQSACSRGPTSLVRVPASLPEPYKLLPGDARRLQPPASRG